MSAPVPGRAAIAAAEPLDFPDRRPARQELTITITAYFDGFATEVCFSGSIDQLTSVIRRLRELGAEPTMPPAAPAPAGRDTARKPATRVQPFYDGDGQACCPVHKKALVEGSYGLYCPAKAQPGDAQNAKGYCSLRFE